MSATKTDGSSLGTASENGVSSSLLPRMIVFDLDDCLWSPEMHELVAKPSIPKHGDLQTGKDDDQFTATLRGVVGLQVPRSGDTVRLFQGARKVLYELATHPEYQTIVLAAASSSLEPSFSYACLEAIEILPHITMSEIFSHVQIGRTPPLSSDKRTHFQLLHQESGIAYQDMLFFDDCNWGDHCAAVSKQFGVTGQRTPNGLRYQEFQQGLDKHRQKVLQRRSQQQ